MVLFADSQIAPFQSNISFYELVNTMSLETSQDGAPSENDTGPESPLPPDFTQVSPLNKDCIIVYVVLFLFAAVGNLSVLYCVSRYDRLGKSRTPLLIMNLCIADLIVTFFLIPTEIFWRWTISWKGGNLLCKLCQFVRAFGMYLSSNVVICVSIDRYFAIVHPLKLAGAVRRVKCMLVTAWVVSAVFAGPQIFVYHVASHPEYPEFRQCITTAFLTTGPYNELIYNVSSVSALYFIPLLVIIFTYTRILCKIHQKAGEHQVANGQLANVRSESSIPQKLSRRQQTPSSLSPCVVITFHETSKLNSHVQSEVIKRPRPLLRCSANQTATLTRARSRTLRLTLLILLTFLFCWTPYVVITLWYMVDRGGASQVDERLQEALFIMAVANSVLNPVIYGTVGRKQDFQKCLLSLVRRHRLETLSCCCWNLRADGERRNSDSILITANHRSSPHSRGVRKLKMEPLNNESSTPNASPHLRRNLPPTESIISPSSQIVALKTAPVRTVNGGADNSSSNSHRARHRGIFSRFVTSLSQSLWNVAPQTKNRFEFSCASSSEGESDVGGATGNRNECRKCGSVVAEQQYIRVRPRSFAASQASTEL